MSSRTFRWAIAGTGRIAHDFTVALTEVEGAETVAVASRTKERADEFATAHDIPRAHGTYEALADDADVDVVYVATPHARHEPDTLLFLDGGKHVLCEKPFALNAEQAIRMIDAARARGLFLMEALWSRFLPAYREIVDTLSVGTIGTPLLVDGEFGFRIEQIDPTHRLFDPALGGGALLDLGVYPLHLATMVLGVPSKVVATAALAPTGVDQTVVATLGYDEGALAVVTASLGLSLRGGGRIVGTGGSIALAPPMHRPERLTVTSAEGVEHRERPITGSGLAAQAREVQRCLASGLVESPMLPLDETVAVMQVLDQVRHQIGVRYPGER